MSEAALRAMTLSGRSVQAGGSEGLRAVADERRLMQVLDNLLGNALKHAGPHAEVSMAARSDGPDVIVDVIDTGAGIPADEVEHVFDRYYRARATRDVPGAGLGLAIARSLTEAMGGSISVRSKVGEGTAFSIRLRGVGESDETTRRMPLRRSREKSWQESPERG
jgi:signal transduction histidine kinase